MQMDRETASQWLCEARVHDRTHKYSGGRGARTPAAQLIFAQVMMAGAMTSATCPETPSPNPSLDPLRHYWAMPLMTSSMRVEVCAGGR